MSTLKPKTMEDIVSELPPGTNVKRRVFEVVLPVPKVDIRVFIANPEKCPQCKRMWKRDGPMDKSEECPECRSYLDDES